MPLRKQKASIKFSKGVQGKVDHKVLPKENLTLLENGRFSKLGAINKRSGYALVDEASSDLVGYKDSLVSRNVIIGDKAASGTVTPASVFNYSSQKFVGDHGFSEGIDYTFMPVSKGSMYRQEDSNTALSSDGKYACITFVDVLWDQTNSKAVYNKRFSIVDRETNALIASDVKLGAATYSGNNGRRMRPIWVPAQSKFYIFGDDEMELKVWVVDPTVSPIVVKDTAGTTTKAGTVIIAFNNYPIATSGTYVITGASFDVCSSATTSKVNIYTSYITGSTLMTRYYQFTAPSTVSSVIWADNNTLKDGTHLAIHRATVSGTHANKLAFFHHDGDSDELKFKTGTEAGGSYTEHVSAVTSTQTSRCVFRNSLNPLYTDNDDVQAIVEVGETGAIGVSGAFQIVQMDGIHERIETAVAYYRTISKKARFAFALGSGPVSVGIYHDDNPGIAASGVALAEVPINTIELCDLDTNSHPESYSSKVTNYLDATHSLPVNMFNGYTTGDPCWSASGETMSVTFEPPIPYSSSVDFYVGANSSGAEYEWRLNGTGGFTGMGTSFPVSATDVTAHSGSGVLTQLEFKKASASMDVYRVRVDGTTLYDPHLPMWRRDYLPISTFMPEWIPDALKSDAVTGASAHLNGEVVSVPLGHAYERFGAAGTTVLNSITHLFDFRRYNEERVDVPAATTSVSHDVLYVADKGLFQYDGDKFHAIGFHDRPMISAALVSSSSGNLGTSAAGTYGDYFYKAVYEWIDAQGNLHESEPSAPVQITTDSTHEKATITIADLDYSGWNTHDHIQFEYRKDQRLALYRTQKNGSLYNLLMTIPIGGKENGYHQVVDDITDVIAGTGRFIYTDSGELSNKPPPASARYVITHRDRLFVIGKDDMVYFSKLIVDGFGVGFNEGLSIKTPDNITDPPTALGSMDGNLFIFTERSIYIVGGEGPDNTGSGGFYDVKRIPANVGAIKGSPVKLISDGLLFVSENDTGTRINMLGRNMAISPIGSAVEDILNPEGGTPYTVRDIVTHSQDETVYFLLSQVGGTPEGVKLLTYNFVFKQWGVDKLLDTYGAGAGGSLAFSTVKGRRKLYIGLIHHADNQNPRTYIEASGFKDNSVYVPMKVKTAWINLGGIQSYQRVYNFHILGESKDKHTLTVNVYYDYVTTDPDSYTFTTSSATDAKLQFRGHLTKQKCQAIQFEVVDADNAGSTDDGYTITEIALEIGLRSDGYRKSNVKLNTTSTVGSN